MGEILVVRGVFGVEAELDVYKSRLDGRYTIMKSVWMRIKQQLVLFYGLKECFANCAKKVAQSYGRQ